MKPVYNCSLVLASHGSTASQSGHRPEFEIASQLQKFGIFSKVTPGFLSGDPHASEVLDTLPAGDVVVIPMTSSDGYFSEVVIPGKLQANTRLNDFRLMITAALGSQAAIKNLVLARVIEIILEHSLTPDDTSIVIAGYGGPQNENDEFTVNQLADSIRMTLSGIAVEVGFLNQNPHLELVAAKVETRNKIVVPFLISRDIQSVGDIPAAFGLTPGTNHRYPLRIETPTEVCIFDEPVGAYQAIADVCLDLATNRMAGLQAA